MEPILKSILENKTENYLLPFFWQHDGHDAEIPARVQKIYESGCRAFCVESRPYEHFCADAWWKTMDIILAEAVKAGENDVEVFVCNTLAQRMQDFFSTYMTLPASGITGKVRLFVQ